MILYFDGKSQNNMKVAVDFVKARLKSGKEVVITWDDAVHGYSKDGIFFAGAKGCPLR